MLKNNKSIRFVSFSKVILVVYLLVLLWLVLFKFSFDILFVLENHQVRSLNIVPFTGHLREMIENFIIFIPFGLLLSASFKQITIWQKLALVSFSSFAIEAFQFIFAIGITDATDIITNTLGGLVGIGLYALCEKRVDSIKLNYFINAVVLILIVLLLALRIFVFRVKY
jgi:glycopeptide antibiotics resistance protein